MDNEWSSRIETKLDRIAESLAGQVAETKANKADVEELKTTTTRLKEVQDKQRGAVNLVVVLSLVATICVALIEGARFFQS